MALKINIEVELDGGRTLTAVADQRDFAAVEAQEIGPAQRNTWVRFIAWSALTRSRQYTGTWETFNTVDCVQASDVGPEEPAGDENGLDPGPKRRAAAN
ncbi:MAG TPA: hypothetical protein VFM50_02860 [Nocardioidaceae bacterium]|nr:hypothetical protein [Nocardioidaceae bacterium]